ncbi:MAG: glycosyl hydrolase [Pseudomonadota bacterium]
MHVSRWALSMLCSASLAGGCSKSSIDEAPAKTPVVAETPAVPPPSEATSPRRLLIIGQDLDAIRGYLASDCCPRPDGVTAYVDFYNTLAPDAGFGGLGIDTDGLPYAGESDWGGGPANALISATEAGAFDLALGLSITENDHPGGLDRIVAGEHDEEIRHLARFASRLPATLYLRIGYEFDGFWNQGYDNAERYVAAYRRIVDGLREAGADNVAYVWQGSASTTDDVLDGGRHDAILDWYPGDEYVDWVGLSWFMHPDEKPGVDPGFSIPTPRALSDELVVLARERGKPVMIAEASPQGFDLRAATEAHHVGLWDGEAGTGAEPRTPEEIWEAWYQPLFDYMNAHRDVIQALAYINVRWDDQDLWDAPYESGYWGDTRLEVSPEIAQRFTTAISEWRQ